MLWSSTYSYHIPVLTIFISGSLRNGRHHSRAGSWGQRLVTALTHNDSMRESKGSITGHDRVWYDQFTSTDWVHDSIEDAHRVLILRSRKDIRGRVEAFFDGAQGWILSALVGFLTAITAYIVDVSEAPVFDWKDGYCSKGFFVNEKVSWSEVFSFPEIKGILTLFSQSIQVMDDGVRSSPRRRIHPSASCIYFA